MDATFGISTKGRTTLLYRNFEYVKERDNVNGSTDEMMYGLQFKVVPSIFFQLYKIHFNFIDAVNPVGVYCLMI